MLGSLRVDFVHHLEYLSFELEVAFPSKTLGIAVVESVKTTAYP